MSSPVHTLLSASRAAADNRRRHAGRATAEGVIVSQPNLPQAEHFAAEALRLRLEAHALDPDHTDPSWGFDTAPHQQLVDFLTQYPLIP